MATAQEIAANNMAFLINSIKRALPMAAPNGTAYSAGSTLTFTAPVVPGWAYAIRLFCNLTVTANLGTGTAHASQAAPYNVFQRVRLSFGGQEHRNHNGYFLKVLRQTTRRNDSAPWYAGGSQSDTWATSILSPALFTTGIPGASITGNTTWSYYVDIPLQTAHGSVAGMLPMGSSASPITLNLDCASNGYGTDPLLNPFIVTGNAVPAITGTVTAQVLYRFGQSAHDPQAKVPTPVIGSFAKILQSEDAINTTNVYQYHKVQEPYPMLKVMNLVVTPGAGENGTDFVAVNNVSGARFDLDPGTQWYLYDSSGANILGLWADQRERYGVDLDEGVIVWDEFSGNDPAQPNGLNTPNIALYNSAQVGVQLSGGLGASNNRLVTASMFIEPLPF